MKPITFATAAKFLLIAIAAAALVFIATPARADIYQWEYIDPSDPSQGKRPSTTLVPDGLGVDAVPGAQLGGRDLTMAHLVGADLTGADGYQTNLTDADLGQANLTDAFFLLATLSDAKFSEANLTNANLGGTMLTGADFTDAEIRGVNFNIICILGCAGSGITLAQVYSTASYQSHDLSGVGLIRSSLSGGNFAGQNLTNANFGSAILDGADFRGADARGAILNPADTITTNLILPNGHINGLDVSADNSLVVRDYDGDFRYDLARPPIPLSVDEHLSMSHGGTLRMVLEADAWDSTFSFAPGIPVTLGGTLELTFAADVDAASQVGRTFDLFDWTGVDSAGAFAVSSPYAWDLSNLYITGEVTLMAVPEPATFVLLTGAAAGCRQRRNRGR